MSTIYWVYEILLRNFVSKTNKKGSVKEENRWFEHKNRIFEHAKMLVIFYKNNQSFLNLLNKKTPKYLKLPQNRYITSLTFNLHIFFPSKKKCQEFSKSIFFFISMTLKCFTIIFWFEKRLGPKFEDIFKSSENNFIF